MNGNRKVNQIVGMLLEIAVDKNKKHTEANLNLL